MVFSLNIRQEIRQILPFQVIRDHLWTCDVTRILQVRLGSPSTEDCYYWLFSSHGKFTLRSCYYQILAQAIIMDTSNSGTSIALSTKEWQSIRGFSFLQKSERSFGELAMRFFRCEQIWWEKDCMRLDGDGCSLAGVVCWCVWCVRNQLCAHFGERIGWWYSRVGETFSWCL